MRTPASTRLSGAALAALAAVFAPPPAARAGQIPPQSYVVQGHIAQRDGTSLPDGPANVQFSLWDGPTDGDSLYDSLQTVMVQNGAFATTLESDGGFANANFVFFPIYLETQVGDDPPMTPRRPMAAVPTAFYAARLTLNGVNAASLADGAVTTDKLDTSVTSGGPAGGDLTGSYPSPQLPVQVALLNKVSGGLMSAAVTTTPSVDQQQTTHNGGDYVPTWQSFTPSKYGLLTGLDIWIGSRDGKSHTATLKTYVGDGPSGSPLTSQTITYAANANWQHYDFPTPIPVSAGVRYTWETSSYVSILIGYYGSAGDAYPGGRGGSGVDYAFKTYVTVPGVGIGLAPTSAAGVAVTDPGSGVIGLLVGSPANVSTGSNTKILISEDAATGQWPFQVDRAGATIFAIKQDGSVFSASSRRYKDNIAPLSNPLGAAMKLQAMTFDWKPAFGGGHDIGLVAEDAARTMPELAVQSADGKETLGVRYDRLGVVAIGAIQQQQSALLSHQKELAALTARLAALETARAASKATGR